MRALIAVTETESDSMVMECTRVSSELSVSDGNLMNSLNGPGDGGGVGVSLQPSRFFGLATDAILHRSSRTGHTTISTMILAVC